MTTERPDAEQMMSMSLLQLTSVRVAFGGLLALAGIDLDVGQGDRLAILGPNGAGKTTLFNVIAGDIVATAGTVTINGRDVTTAPSRHRPSLGVARTYQKTRLFPGLTVEENLMLARVGKVGGHRRFRRGGPIADARARAGHVAEQIWLADDLHRPVADLSHGQQRQLEVGMASITEPDLLLLDEPASGLSRGERERLVEFLVDLDRSVTLILIEHDMDVALRVADRVMVMADGRTVTEGDPTSIREDERVHEIYLGTRS
ncbi:MAG: ABC transporter ATP-binding protein [Actinomycetota bacterium]